MFAFMTNYSGFYFIFIHRKYDFYVSHHSNMRIVHCKIKIPGLLVKDVRLHLEAGLDVLEPTLRLHQSKLLCAALTVQLFHIQGATGHALCPLDILDELQDAILAGGQGLLEAS